MKPLVYAKGVPAPPPPDVEPWRIEVQVPAGYIRDSLGVLTPKRHVTSAADWSLFFKGRPR